MKNRIGEINEPCRISISIFCQRFANLLITYSPDLPVKINNAQPIKLLLIYRLTIFGPVLLAKHDQMPL